MYKDTPLDTQTPYVRSFLAFLGITDVTFLYAEGLAMGEEQKDTALKQAQSEIANLLDDTTTAVAA